MQYGPPMMQPQQQEPVFLNLPGAYVSRSRVVLGGVTYPVNAISHVRQFYIPKSPWWIIIGFVSALIGAFSLANSGGGGGAFFLLVGATFIVIYFKGIHNQYGIALGASGAERNAIISKDRGFVQAIEQAINNALASRY